MFAIATVILTWMISFSTVFQFSFLVQVNKHNLHTFSKSTHDHMTGSGCCRAIFHFNFHWTGNYIGIPRFSIQSWKFTFYKIRWICNIPRIILLRRKLFSFLHNWVAVVVCWSPLTKNIHRVNSDVSRYSQKLFVVPLVMASHLSFLIIWNERCVSQFSCSPCEHW